jgi:predicted transcriptional regulator
MAKKKKPARKPATKARGKKIVKKAKAKTVKKAAAKPPAKKAKKAAPAKGPEGLRVNVSPQLESRLKALAKSMDITLAQVLIQAVTEFAETWEDHQRTVAALSEGDDRMQLVVPQE